MARIPPDKATGTHISYLSLISEDIVGLAKFYQEVLGLEERTELRSESYIALDVAGVVLGFSAAPVFEMLNIEPGGPARNGFTTFEVADAAAVARKARMAVHRGGLVLKASYDTAYGSRQAVLADPDGNVFRINSHRWSSDNL